MVKHAKSPQMTVQEAANYLGESRGWAYKVLNIYKKTGNFDFSKEKRKKRVICHNSRFGMVSLATAAKPAIKEAIAQNFTQQGTPVSRWTVVRRLREHDVRWKSLLKKP